MSERASYSLRCTTPACRWARLLLPTLGAALEIARLHASPRHVVALTVETRRELGRIGDGAPIACEREARSA